MSPLALNLAAVVGLVTVGAVVDSRLQSGSRLRALPTPLQLTVGGVAIAPLTLFADRLAVGPLDGLVVGFAVSAALWIALPTLLSRVVDAENSEAVC